MINWTPTGFVGEMFRTIAAHVPPAPVAKPPGLWGTPGYLEELFGDAVTLRTETRTVSMRFLSPEHFADFFIANYGPTHKAFESLTDDARHALRNDLIALAGRYNRADDGTAVCDFGYISVVAAKH